MRIIVSGGGTAGHISPALAVCDALKSLDSSIELLYVGEATGMEAKIVAAAGLDFRSIPAGKFRRDQRPGVPLLVKLFNRRTVLLNARDLIRVSFGIAASLKIILSFKPDAVFLKGGFVCLPVGMAARIAGVPYAIHESDVSPGLANRILGRWATKIAVGFPVKNYRSFPVGRLVYTGNPVRAQIKAAGRADALARFELDPALPVILVTGGSQGAAAINDAVLDALPDLLERVQILHQVGEGQLTRVSFLLGRRPPLAHPARYQSFAVLPLADMALALAAADIVVGRAGVGTITDSAVLGKTTVLIPNNRMAAHQLQNARMLARNGAARVIDPDRLSGETFKREIISLLDSGEERDRLAAAIRQYARPNADQEIARLVCSLVGNRLGAAAQAKGAGE